MVSEIELLSTLPMPIRIGGAHKVANRRRARPAGHHNNGIKALYAGRGGAVDDEWTFKSGFECVY